MIIWLNVPYKDKDLAKRCGAKWNAAKKKWFAENLESLDGLMKWMPDHLKKAGTSTLAGIERPKCLGDLRRDQAKKSKRNRPY
jgi:hypothetical protein